MNSRKTNTQLRLGLNRIFFLSFQFRVPCTAAAPVAKLISETRTWHPAASSLPSFEFPKMSPNFFLRHVFIVHQQKKISRASDFQKNRNNGFVLVDDY
jgi:hypothetical protein